MVNILILGAAIYVLICAFLYIKQENFIFFPAKLAPNYKFLQFKEFNEVYFEPEVDILLHALHFKVKDPKGLIIYFHGNTGALDRWGYWSTLFTSRGYDVIMPDYRSYGKSTGTFTEETFYEDSRFIFTEVQERFSYQKIVLYGRSLGSGPATQLAQDVKVDFLLLETPYASIPRVISTKIKFVPVDLLVKYKFENFKKLPSINCPVHIFHGTNDELIPYSEAEYLSEQGASISKIIGGGHNDLADYKLFQDDLSKILL